MNTKTKDLYEKAHLVVAAIRVLTHQHATPPSVDAVCETLKFSVEEGLRLCRRLQDKGILQIMEGAFGTRLEVLNHQEIENIPRDDSEDRLQQALDQFRSNRTQLDKKVADFKSQQQKKQKDLFAELNKKLKGQAGSSASEKPGKDKED